MASVYTIATIEPDLLEDEKRKDAAGLIALEHEIPGEVSSYKVNLGGMTGVSFVLEKNVPDPIITLTGDVSVSQTMTNLGDDAKHIVTFDQRTGIQPSFIESLLEDDDEIVISKEYDPETPTVGVKDKSAFLASMDDIDEKYFVKLGKDKGYLRGVIMLYEDYLQLKEKDKNGVLTIVEME